MHLLRLAGNFCCISKLFLRPLKISLLCFRAIINHFNPKIESYAAVNHISQLSEDQVSQACQVFSHVDLWNVDVQEYLVLPGTDDVAAVERCKWDSQVPRSDEGERKKSKNCFGQFYHHIERFWSHRCRRMGTNKKNIQRCQQVYLDTVRVLAFRMGQDVFGSKLSYQRIVERSVIVLVILGTLSSESNW